MIKNTYFGFTDNMTPMQKERSENTLDKLVKSDGIVSTEKEWALNKLFEGYLPKLTENHTYYSSRIDGYTKPKTRYELQKENNFFETTKTVYNFVLHLIESGITSMKIANEYAKIEIDRLNKLEEEKRQSEILKLQEEQERKAIEKVEREKRHAENAAKWNENGLELMTDGIKKHIAEGVEEFWNEISKRTTSNKEEFIQQTIETFTSNMGNQAFILSNVPYIFHDELNSGNLNNKIFKSFYKRIFNIVDNDPKITITAKVKAFYDGRVYKGTKPIELETFYIHNVKTKEFEERQGEKRIIEGYICYISKNEKGLWTITESQTGMSFTSSQKSKQDAINKTKESIVKNPAQLERVIKNAIESIGLSPLYT